MKLKQNTQELLTELLHTYVGEDLTDTNIWLEIQDKADKIMSENETYYDCRINVDHTDVDCLTLSVYVQEDKDIPYTLFLLKIFPQQAEFSEI